MKIPEWLVPEKYRRQAVIAGGYAAYPSRAADIDVWIYDVEDRYLDAVRLELIEHVASTSNPEAFVVLDDARTASGYKMEKILIKKVIKGYRDGHEWHLLVTNADGIFELLESFDVSTHQAAISPITGALIKGSLFTEVYEAPAKLRDTPTTDARMEKIAARYKDLRFGEQS